MVAVSAELAERERIKAERARARRARYESRVKGTDKELSVRKAKSDANLGKTNHHAPDEWHYSDYPFVMWDGEAPTDTGYSLFGSSDGHQICKPHLTTEECFDLLLDAKRDNPKSIFFWFGGRYDWDEITRQSIPLQKLARLKNGGTLWWHGYRLTEIEGKIYTIQKDGVSVRIFEVSGWFHTSYVKALRTYHIGTELCAHGVQNCANDGCKCVCTLCRIELGKSGRGSDQFTYQAIKDIRRYMGDELALGPPLMERIRRICLDAGFNPRGWYGPSALARELLTRHKIRDAMAVCPAEVNRAAQFAFAGGRFESFRGGNFNCTVYEKDKNSAYMHAALNLPNLAKGRWRKGRQYEAGKFGVYHIRYKDVSEPFDVMKPQPLFRRMNNGTVCWPRRTDSWYWSPEAELVSEDSGAVFLEAWIFDEEDNSDRPFAFVADLFRKRLVLQSLADDNPTKAAEMAFKWALASIYGQLCRLVGWDKKNKKAPQTHQLEWAGYITSHCRADMYRVAMECGEGLVSIDTDSVTSFRSVPVPEGRQLGEWKTEVYDGGIWFQSGVYFARHGTEWKKGKTRGAERRQNNTAGLSPELLSDAIREGLSVRLHPRRRYITTRMALNGQLRDHGTWREHPGNILEFGGGGKRYHNAKLCSRYCDGEIHAFLPSLSSVLGANVMDIESVPHYLPWKDDRTDNGIDVKLLTDLLWVNTESIDSDDQWLVELVRET